MILFAGESVRSKSDPVGQHECGTCHGVQHFTEQHESLWFCVFWIPVVPLQTIARYWRCEQCLTAYLPGDTQVASSAQLVKRIVSYLLLGYNQRQHQQLAAEICLKLTGYPFELEEYQQVLRDIESGNVDIIDHVRSNSSAINGIGKQQILEAAFLATYVCCDLEYEDRLRINLIGNALGVGLEFVEYSIAQSRKQNHYGIRRLGHVESAV
jgi:hypothetical protein